MTKAPFFAALLAVTAPALAGDKEVPPATPIGEPISCVRTPDIRSTKVRSDSVIDFEMRNGKVYRNTLPASCPSLGFEQRFSYRTSLSQLCSVDIITVLQASPVMAGPSCGLGKFQQVELAKK